MNNGQINLIFAWIWISLGFVSGAAQGMFFHREGWLGGYTAFKRRLYRLAHISIFALAMINLLFYFTVQVLPSPSLAAEIASWGFLVGAVLMPFCCLIVAHIPKLRMIFSIPVLSLFLSGILTGWEVFKL